VEDTWPAHLPELDLAINTGLRKGSQYGLTWDMVDWKSRELHIPRTKNEEPLHVPLKRRGYQCAQDGVEGRGWQRTRLYISEDGRSARKRPSLV
jgi:integrase